jgi:hypothetical protein
VNKKEVKTQTRKEEETKQKKKLRIQEAKNK